LKGSFGKLFSYAVEGSPYAQPLVVQNVNMGARGLRNVVYVATTNDLVYALDAAGDARSFWSKILASDNEISLPARRKTGTGVGIISGNIGILSTPVIDRKTNTIYVVASTMAFDQKDDKVTWRLHALDLATGKEKFGAPVTIAPALDVGGRHYVFDPSRQINRAALAIAASRVIIAWGSLDDQLQYHGWVMSYAVHNPTKSPDVFCTACNSTGKLFGGSIWQSGRPPAIVRDKSGRENGFFFTANGYTNGKKNDGDFQNACSMGSPRPDACFANALNQTRSREQSLLGSTMGA